MLRRLADEERLRGWRTGFINERDRGRTGLENLHGGWEMEIRGGPATVDARRHIIDCRGTSV